MPPIKNTSPKAKGEHPVSRQPINFGLAPNPTAGQLREAERLRRVYQRTGKQKHRVAYEKHTAAMLAGLPDVTSEDLKKKLAWGEVKRQARDGT